MMIPMQWPTAHCPHGPAGSPHVRCLREGRGALGGPQCVTVCCAFAVTNGQLQQLSQTSETSSSISSYSSGPAPGAVNGLGTASPVPPARTVDVAISTEDGPRRGWVRERAERAMQTEPVAEGLPETRRATFISNKMFSFHSKF